jgi:hypothetical protein
LSAHSPPGFQFRAPAFWKTALFNRGSLRRKAIVSRRRDTRATERLFVTAPLNTFSLICGMMAVRAN